MNDELDGWLERVRELGKRIDRELETFPVDNSGFNGSSDLLSAFLDQESTRRNRVDNRG